MLIICLPLFKRTIAMLLAVITTLLCHLLVIKGEVINEPSLRPADPFVPSADAETLKSQLEKLVKDRDKIANIMFHRTLNQRLTIRSYYNEKFIHINRWGQKVYGADLWSDLLRISEGNLWKLYRMIFRTVPEHLSKVLNSCINGDRKEEGAVEEIVCANDNDTKKQIQEYYKKNFQSDVKDHLNVFKKEDAAYQVALQTYCWPPRCQEKKIKEEEAKKEAKALHDIDTKKDKERFKDKLKNLLGKYCEPDLKLIFQNYRKDDHGINDTIDDVFEGNERRAYNVLIRYIENTCKYYADELHHAVDGMGTDIGKINRIIVTRSERDLGCILKEFKTKYKKTFTKRLKGDLVGQSRYLKSIRYLCGKP